MWVDISMTVIQMYFLNIKRNEVSSVFNRYRIVITVNEDASLLYFKYRFCTWILYELSFVFGASFWSISVVRCCVFLGFRNKSLIVRLSPLSFALGYRSNYPLVQVLKFECSVWLCTCRPSLELLLTVVVSRREGRPSGGSPTTCSTQSHGFGEGKLSFSRPLSSQRPLSSHRPLNFPRPLSSHRSLSSSRPLSFQWPLSSQRLPSPKRPLSWKGSKYMFCRT